MKKSPYLCILKARDVAHLKHVTCVRAVRRHAAREIGRRGSAHKKMADAGLHIKKKHKLKTKEI